MVEQIRRTEWQIVQTSFHHPYRRLPWSGFPRVLANRSLCLPMIPLLQEMIGPLVTSFGLVLIALGLVRVLRDGFWKDERSSITSRLVSAVAWLGIASIIVFAITIVGNQLAAAWEANRIPSIIASLVGIGLGAWALLKPALLPRR
jgi:hypothetical protein